MKWLVIACFLLWARHGEGGALKCATESNNAQCPSDHQEIEPQHLDPVTPASSPSRVLPSEVECLPGSEWESNCHSCRCSTEGAAECRRLSSCNSPYTEPIRCKPNTSFVQECNTCTCLEKGEVQCTRMECIKMPARAPSKEALPMGQDCAPGSEWKSGCNDCKCSPEGLRICASIGCPEGQETEPLLRCAPHSLWKKECNTCWCTSDGRAMCTRIGCGGISSDMHFSDDESEPDSQEVQPAVKSALKANVTKKKVCVENRMFIMNCNTCWCNEDGTSYMCTRRVCIPDLPDEPEVEDSKPEKLRIIKRECRPDEVFELDCNMCRCDPDGKSFSCTRRACVDEDIKDVKNQTLSRKVRAAPQEPPKTCKPDQEFRMDCNKCLCDSAGQNFSCTRIDCNALNNNNNGGTRRRRDVSHKVPADCVPGSVFDQGCNVCRCTEDGGHAICTLKRCPNKEDNKVSTTESSFRCNPGEQFKQSCNDCSCSADGKSVFCTLFICDEDLTP
ncbi:uncharacterized protein isoform X3 [Choristoneura fumiferana]|uniref:uncharacterized protein isoform X3 n=1 Tax=Choristoneura fumiferana TaxID=7141 RepID=UPI003D15CAA2